jgi:SAM-dependent methyltransferase
LTEQISSSTKILGETIKLITPGRKSGLPHIVELRFSHLEGRFFVLAGSARSDWVLNARTSSGSKLRTAELVFRVEARLASADESKAAWADFERKYGTRVVREWYPSGSVCLCLTPTGSPTVRGALHGEASATENYQQWRTKEREYYREVEEAFDSASEEYDYTIRNNFINTWIRRRSIGVLMKYANPADTLLEIGCGTGAEAFMVCDNFAGVVATDISSGMIDLLQMKVKAKKLWKKIHPVRVSAAEIASIGHLLEGGRTRLAYSFNGALNCEPNIEAFVSGLSVLLKPKGYFICSIRNTFCLSEALSHAAVFQFGKMSPRKKQPLMVSVGGMDIPSVYYPPDRFAEFFSPEFAVIEMIALPALLPPAYLSNYYVKVRRVGLVLEKLEAALAGRFPFNRMGDQTLFVFQKK